MSGDSEEPPKKKRNMEAFVDRTTKAQYQRFADKCIDFFAKCNVPFAVCENDSFKALIHELRDTMRIPTRKEMAGDLFDKCYERTIARNRDLVQGRRYATIFGDGWKNISNNRKNVVTSMGTGPDFVMLKSLDATKVSETGEFLLSVVKESQRIAQNIYRVTCNAVVTDNANAPYYYKYGTLGKLLAGEAVTIDNEKELEAQGYEDDEVDNLAFPGMFHSRCHAHIANIP